MMNENPKQKEEASARRLQSLKYESIKWKVRKTELLLLKSQLPLLKAKIKALLSIKDSNSKPIEHLPD